MSEIRVVTADDARAACEVLRRSILECCVDDHRNDPAILAKWLRNKTPEIVESWFVWPARRRASRQTRPFLSERLQMAGTGFFPLSRRKCPFAIRYTAVSRMAVEGFVFAPSRKLPANCRTSCSPSGFQLPLT